MIDYTLLRKLCAADGISGDEGEVRDLIINEIKDCADGRYLGRRGRGSRLNHK